MHGVVCYPFFPIVCSLVQCDGSAEAAAGYCTTLPFVAFVALQHPRASAFIVIVAVLLIALAYRYCLGIRDPQHRPQQARAH